MCEDGGGSLYEPRVGYQMMQVREQELERALQERAGHRTPVTGVEYVWAVGVGGLRDAGVLKGVRAMVARVYGGEDWFVRDEGGTGRAECLYERKGGRGGGVRFIVARQTADDRWARGRAAHGAGDEARSRQEAPNRCPNGPLSNTPWGVNQRTGEGAGTSGARATAAATTTGQAAGERAGAAAATGTAGPDVDVAGAAGEGVVVGEQAGEGEARDGAIVEGEGGGRADASGGGTGEDGRKRDREGGGDTMDQGGERGEGGRAV